MKCDGEERVSACQGRRGEPDQNLTGALISTQKVVAEFAKITAMTAVSNDLDATLEVCR
jgi:hypothetical protein